jgi:hypothetical protein
MGSTMNERQLGWFLAVLAVWGCGGDNSTVQPAVPTTIAESRGADQSGQVNSPLTDSLSVLVTDNAGSPSSGVTVTWSVLTGGGTISPGSSNSDANGIASTQFTLGPSEGQQQAEAMVTGLTGSPVIFTEVASAQPGGGPGPVVLSVAAGGNNVQDRYSSDLWVHGNYAYTGTWGYREQLGNVLNVWALDASGAPSSADSVTVADIGTVSDLQVTEDGALLALSGERGGVVGDDGGVYLYSLSNPASPTLVGTAPVPFGGVHTVTLSVINGHLYGFAAKNPGFSGNSNQNQPALLIFDLSNPASPSLVHSEPIPPHYGIHDTYVRDGIAFVFAWDEGVIIYDVGNGLRGGSPASPVEVSRLVTAATSTSSPSVHNGWWFHNPVTSEQRYLFIGQEGPGVVGSQSSGNIHVVDVADLAHPVEVAFFHMNGAGTHNFWMDEAKQVLYAAYYNAGVIALDVSGTLSGDLSGRLLSQIRPGGSRNTYTWGVQLANGSLYAIDMLSGFWQLKTE